jgi:predicted TIM-barrel fold metal-dependent hydrolase
MIEYGTNTTRSIASLIFNGMTTRYSDITFIFSHAGGTMPFLIERFLNGTAAEVVPGVVTKGQGGSGVVGSNPPKNAPKGVLYELRKMYYDVAQSSNAVALRALRAVVPVSQIVFGTDYPYRSTQEHVKGLATSGVFDVKELQAIDRDNAVRILPRYRA